MPRSTFAAVLTAALLVSRASPADDADPLAWKYRRFSLAEGIVTISGGVATLGMKLFVAPKVHTNWTGGILFDDAARDDFRASSAAGRKRAQTISTIPYFSGLVLPFVDAGILAGRGHGDAALQLALIDAEALSFAGVLSIGSNIVFRRRRPYVNDCLAGHDPKFPDCGDEGAQTQSFYSGHTSIAFTAAALTCQHHAALPLYGGGAGDVAACIGTLAAAASDGVGRLIADKHYASDVIVGALVGLSIGTLTPWLLHYRYPVEKTGGIIVLPSFAPNYAGISFGYAGAADPI